MCVCHTSNLLKGFFALQHTQLTLAMLSKSTSSPRLLNVSSCGSLLRRAASDSTCSSTRQQVNHLMSTPMVARIFRHEVCVCVCVSKRRSHTPYQATHKGHVSGKKDSTKQQHMSVQCAVGQQASTTSAVAGRRCCCCCWCLLFLLHEHAPLLCTPDLHRPALGFPPICKTSFRPICKPAGVPRERAASRAPLALLLPDSKLWLLLFRSAAELLLMLLLLPKQALPLRNTAMHLVTDITAVHTAILGCCLRCCCCAAVCAHSKNHFNRSKPF